MDDVILLSRLQFAGTIMFHYLFPPLSIGLGGLMVLMEGLYLKTGDKQYETIARFWTSIFAVVFAMGVATGIVMEFEFGTNWATYSRFVGDVFGSALAAEGIFAFFLESGFLAVLVFGWDRVGPKMHFFSTCMVALGALFSSVWITVANSWQQTPAGFHLVDVMGPDGNPLMIDGVAQQRAEITDFWAVVFNPSSVDRLLHVWIGCAILGAFFVMSISAYYILRDRHVDYAKKMFVPALFMGLIASLLAPIQGHFQAMKVGETQPTKLAAFDIAVPGMLSFLMYGDWSKPVTGLNEFPREDWPPVNLSFQSYHIMVALGMLFIAMTVLGTYFYWRGTLWNQRWLLWTFVVGVIGPYIANQAGWVAAEVGRQPWIVWGMLRTSDGVSRAVDATEVLISIVLFGTIYILLFFIWLYIMNHKIQQGPEGFVSEGPREGGVVEAAAQMTAPGGPSMTEADEQEER
jgi:cytochrome d ubiquinol oxidase subunit I